MIQLLGFCLVATMLEMGDAGADVSAAEGLWQAAERNRLSDAEAQQAAELLDHRHPFVRGIAEWALALKVGQENNGQRAAWPRSDAPAWYRRWAALDGRFLLEADWVRQAVTAGLHRDAARLAASVDSMILRTERMAADFRRQGLGPEDDVRLQALLDRLRATQRRLQEQIPLPPGDPAAEALVAETWLAARQTLREAALLNPAIRSSQVVFVKQFAPHTTRNITRSFSWQHKPGGDICVLNGFQPGAGPRSDPRSTGSGACARTGPLVGRRPGRVRLRPSARLAPGPRHRQCVP